MDYSELEDAARTYRDAAEAVDKAQAMLVSLGDKPDRTDAEEQQLSEVSNLWLRAFGMQNVALDRIRACFDTPSAGRQA